MYAVILAGSSATPLSSITGVNFANSWFEQTLTYTSPASDPNAGQTLKIKLVKDTNVRQVDWDNVRLYESRVLTCEGFLSPFDQPLSLKKKENRAIPVKMILHDGLLGTVITGTDLSAPPLVQVSVGGAIGEDIAGYAGDLLPAGLSDDSNEFRYDDDTQQWIINLGTKQFTASNTYNVTVVPGDHSYVIDGCTGTFTRQP